MPKITKNAKISEKKKRINTEIKRLRRAYQDLPTAKKILAYQLIKQAAYISTTLDDLTEKMYSADSLAEKYEHGENQSGTKPNTYLSCYDTLLKNYNRIIEQLDKMANAGRSKNQDKDSSSDPEGDRLEEFINSR